MRDITLGDTFYHFFTTRKFADGIPFLLAGTPVLSVLEQDNITPITAGVSVQVDRASVAGLNQATIVATGGNGYETGKSYAIYISTGTVDGVSVVGEVVGEFTIEKSAAAIDLANGTDGLGALKADTAAVKLETDKITLGDAGAGVAGSVIEEVENRAIPTDIVSSGAITTSGGAVSSVTLVATTTANTDMRGTEDAALATVLGALADAAAAGDPTSADTLMQYVKQLVNLLAGSAGIVTMPAGLDPANGVNLFEMLRAAMGATFATATDSLEQLQADHVTLQSDTDDVQTRLPAALVGGAMDSDVSVIQAAAAQTIRDEILPTQNAAFNNIEFLFVAASDHVTPVTGAGTMAVTRSIDGGAFGAGTGTGPAEVGNGIYQYDASAADMNGGVITFRFTATSGTPGAPDDTFLTIVTGGGV